MHNALSQKVKVYNDQSQYILDKENYEKVFQILPKI